MNRRPVFKLNLRDNVDSIVRRIMNNRITAPVLDDTRSIPQQPIAYGGGYMSQQAYPQQLAPTPAPQHVQPIAGRQSQLNPILSAPQQPRIYEGGSQPRPLSGNQPISLGGLNTMSPDAAIQSRSAIGARPNKFTRSAPQQPPSQFSGNAQAQSAYPGQTPKNTGGQNKLNTMKNYLNERGAVR